MIKIHDEVADYYTAKLTKFGPNPRGVDWNGEEGQFLRFKQLAKVIREPSGFSLNDLGCGYGALLDFLASEYQKFFYHGIDISSKMVASARLRYAGWPDARFTTAALPPSQADYGVASGIFNVRLGWDDDEWRDYLRSTLDTLDQTSLKGFAFNCLTSYSDEDKMRNDLYYADPGNLFDLCKKHYSKNVALLHDYGLYEFTIIVRK